MSGQLTPERATAATAAIVAQIRCSGDEARRALDAALDALDMVPRDMLDSMEEDYHSERERAVAAEAEADRLREKLHAYIDALDTIRRDHSLVGLAGTVLNRYGRLYPEDGDE